MIAERDESEWSVQLYGSGYNFEGGWLPGDYLLYINKRITGSKPWCSKSLTANYEGEAACRNAQSALGENFQFYGSRKFFTTALNFLSQEMSKIIKTLIRDHHILCETGTCLVPNPMIKQNV
tara:strand:- start:840 stop:1205 length:366 start_codon:yes stop_codon:yes gene_type:complete